MSVYAKLQKCRVELQGIKLKKSGKNKFAGYEYFELSDFLPTINELFDAVGLFSHFHLSDDRAVLTVCDVDKPESFVEFVCPSAEATLKGCHPVQNLGAQITYLRRYLYVNALEIVEHDALEATTGKETPVPNRVDTVDYKSQLLKTLSEKGIDAAVWVKQHTGKAKITQAEAKELLASAKTLPDDDIPIDVGGMTPQDVA